MPGSSSLFDLLERSLQHENSSFHASVVEKKWKKQRDRSLLFFFDFSYSLRFVFRVTHLQKSPCCHFPKESGNSTQCPDSQTASCPRAQAAAQSTHHFFGQRGERSWAYRCVLHLELTATAASVQPTAGGPLP